MFINRIDCMYFTNLNDNIVTFHNMNKVLTNLLNHHNHFKVIARQSGSAKLPILLTYSRFFLQMADNKMNSKESILFLL